MRSRDERQQSAISDQHSAENSLLPPAFAEVTAGKPPHSPLLYSTWALVDSGPAPGQWNMDTDLALMEGMQADLAEGREPVPVLRLYAWEPPAVSLGYSQTEDDIAWDVCREHGVDVVQRPTGGRAILHKDELTYCIIVPANIFGREMGIMGSYQVLSTGILEGLRTLGVDAQLAGGLPRPERNDRDRLRAACFAVPSRCDAVAGGKKVVGSAQVRRRGVILQHGSIPLRPREEEERLFILGPDAPEIECLGSLEEALGRPISYQEAASAVVEGYRRALGITFLPSFLQASAEGNARVSVSPEA